MVNEQVPDEPIEGVDDLPDEVKDGDVAEADEKAETEDKPDA